MPTKKEFVATDLSEEEIRKVKSYVLSSANYVAILLLSCNRQAPMSETYAIAAAVCWQWSNAGFMLSCTSMPLAFNSHPVESKHGVEQLAWQLFCDYGGVCVAKLVTGKQSYVFHTTAVTAVRSCFKKVLCSCWIRNPAFLGWCSNGLWSFNIVSLLDGEMQVLGADGLLYQSIDDLLAVAQSLNPDIQQFEASCFTGKFWRVLADCSWFGITGTAAAWCMHPQYAIHHCTCRKICR